MNFNCLLALVLPDVLDYVVVHELCHRKELNHSERFWTAVGRILPDYKLRRKWLKYNGTRLLERLCLTQAPVKISYQIRKTDAPKLPGEKKQFNDQSGFRPHKSKYRKADTRGI